MLQSRANGHDRPRAAEIAAALGLQARTNGRFRGDCPACGWRDTFTVRDLQFGSDLNCFQCRDRAAVRAAVEQQTGLSLSPATDEATDEATNEKRRADMRRATNWSPSLRRRKTRSEKKQERAHVRKVVSRYRRAKPASLDHPCLAGLEKLPGDVRVDQQDEDALLIPMMKDGDVVSVQTHQLESGGIVKGGPLPGKREKRNAKDIPKVGTFHVIPGTTDTIYILEGLRTGGTIAEATDAQTYVAFDAGNLIHVGRAVRQLHPDAELVFAADQDVNGTGQRDAEKAASAVGGKVATPGFKRPSKRRNDFHDLRESRDRRRRGYGLKAVRRRLRKAQPVKADTSTLQTVKLSDVRPQVLRWLFRPLIPSGKVTLLVGDPGMSKSLWTTDLAARVSTGARWPTSDENAPKGSVILLSAEDDLPDTIQPRLDAAGADLTRIHAVSHERHFSLEKDLPRLAEKLDEISDVRLIVIDPISAYLGSADSHKNSDVRSLLAPLADLAQKSKAAILAVSHLNKAPGNAIYRTTGSLAFVAAARSVLAVVKDQNDPDRRLVLPVKQNLTPNQAGIAYKIKQVTTKSRQMAPVIMYESDFVEGKDYNIEEALSPKLKSGPTKIEKAKDWLKTELRDGPLAERKILMRAKIDGLSEGTIRRAKIGLGIKSKKQHGSKYSKWQWQLPSEMTT